MTFLFAWRYFKAKKTTNAINIIAWISIVAIVVGTAALILVLSVFNGFEDLVKSLYSSFYTDFKISAEKGKTIHVSNEQLAKLKGLANVKNYSLTIEERALIQNGDYQSVVSLKAVDANYRYTSGIADHLVKGQYDLGNEEDPKLILGTGVEGALGVEADRNIFILRVILPRRTNSVQLDPLNGMSNDSIRTSSTFAIQADFDNKYAITNIDFVRRALKWDADEYTSIEIQSKYKNNQKEFKKQLEAVFGKGYLVQNFYEQNSELYSVMTMERWVIYGVLSLILVVAAFNMIGALMMLVLEKRKDINILHSLGASRGFIKKVFLAEGLLLATVGTAIGMLIAYLIVFLQLQFHLVPMGQGSFLINYFPVKIEASDFFLVTGTVFVIALVAAWFPSVVASRQEFSLRSE